MNLPHGIWVIVPPEVIPPGGTGVFESESDGFATGTEGSVQYSIDRSSNIVGLSWDNPYVGSNSYGHTQPAGYTISQQGGGGDNANVTFTLSHEG